MVLRNLIEERLTHSAIGAFFEVYNTLGFGFLETVYVMALERELIERGHRVSRELWVPVLYKGDELCKQRLDMVVDEKLIIETKATPDLPKTGSRQLHNYLRATKLSVGLLFHFGPEPKFYRVVSPALFLQEQTARLASRTEGSKRMRRMNCRGRICLLRIESSSTTTKKLLLARGACSAPGAFRPLQFIRLIL